jgi:hypothetical protein
MKNILICALSLILFTSCSDVMESDLGKSGITVLAPANNAINPNYVQTFWWDFLNGASSYQLQIVRPKFDSVLVLVLDTIIQSNKFSISLFPGNYQWRVKAINGSSETQYVTRSLSVVASSLSGQTVVVNSPENLLESSSLLQNFNWQTLFGATRYRFQIDTLQFNDEVDLVYNNTLAGVLLYYTFLNDGIYQWRVRAENDTANSLWSDIKTITIDRVAPSKVELLSPINNSTNTSPLTFSWNALTDANSYKLYVYKTDSTILFNSNYPLKINNTTSAFALGTSGQKLYWQVSAVDRAGNEGEKSAKRSFIVQ